MNPDTFGQSAEWLTGVLLIATRLAGVLLFSTVLGFSSLPIRVRLLFVLSLSAAFASVIGIPAGIQEATHSVYALLGTALRELTLGAAMGFGILAIFGAFMLGGRVLDYQLGFSVATLFDPANRTQGPLLGVFLSMLAATVFVVTDAHHTLLRAFIYSFRAVPLGTARCCSDVEPMISQFGLLFVFGLLIVAPALVALAILDVSIGVMARSMPQVNTYFVTQPARSFLGITVMSLSLRFTEPLMTSMFSSIFRYWQQLV